MHSSGTRTGRLLTVSHHALGRGVCIPACTGQGEGVSTQGGVCPGVVADTPRDQRQTPTREQNE